MQIDPLALSTILGMALVTYATRAGGLWLMSRVRLSPRVDAWLRHIPSAVLTAIIAPLVMNGGPPALLATLVTALIALRTKNLLLSIVAGVATVWALRQIS